MLLSGTAARPVASSGASGESIASAAGNWGNGGATGNWSIGGTAGTAVLGGGGSVAAGMSNTAAAPATSGKSGAGGATGGGELGNSGGHLASAGAPTVDRTCTPATDLIANAASSVTGNWFGGIPARSDDNPCGFQGVIFAGSDDGLDSTPGTADDSLRIPGRDYIAGDPRSRLSPCSGGRCCISGTTSTWPLVDGATDYTASVWGAIFGLSFADPGNGLDRRPYDGPAKGLVLKLSGTLSGQELRFRYVQSQSDNCTPFISSPSGTLGTFVVPFQGAACPSWTCTPACRPGSMTPTALEILVVGGEVAGEFEVCLESATPIL